MLIDEQADNLELTNTRQPWNLISDTIATVSGTSEYTLDSPMLTQQYAGKVYFVVRSTADDALPFLPVPFDDFNALDYGQMMPSPNAAFLVQEKVAFYRTGLQNQTIKLVIQPTPQEVLSYTAYFVGGMLDRTAAAMTGVPIVPEIADRRNLRSVVALLPYAEWEGLTRDQNTEKRRELAAGVGFQLERLDPIVEEYISQINSQHSFEIGYWND